MMKSIVISAITVPFLVGLGFGFNLKLTPQLQLQLGLEQSRVLRIAVPAEALPEDLIECFKVQHSVAVDVVAYHDSASLNQLLSGAENSKSIDIVLVTSNVIPGLIQAGLIQGLDVSKVSNLQNIAADFLDNPAEHGHQFSVPLVWGVQVAKGSKPRGEASAPLPVVSASLFQSSTLGAAGPTRAQQPALWVRSFVLPVRSSGRDLAYEFINYFLEPEVALELSMLTAQSSTNRTIESSELSPHLKPSHLRRQKLAEILRPSANN